MQYKWTLHSRTSKQVKHLWFAKLRIFCEFFFSRKNFVKFEFSIYAVAGILRSADGNRQRCRQFAANARRDLWTCRLCRAVRLGGWGELSRVFIVVFVRISWRLLDWRITSQSAIATARSELRNVLFLPLSVTFLFVYEISREPLNGFASNSHGWRVWTSLNVTGDKNGIFPALSAACVRFMFGKTKHL